MNEADIQEIIRMSNRMSMLLGIATTIVMDYKAMEDYHSDKKKCQWFLDAVDAVIYKNKPIPDKTF